MIANILKRRESDSKNWMSNQDPLSGSRQQYEQIAGSRLEQCNVAIIGCGHWGTNHIRAFEQSPQAKVSWVCDLDSERLNVVGRNFPSIKLTSSIRDVLSDPNVDAISIATPASTHYDIATQALESKKHVLIEKPMAKDSQRAEALAEKARVLGKVLMVGHIYCYVPGVVYMKQLISEGKLGKLHYGIGLRMGLGPIRQDASCTWDLASHDIAMLDYLLGVSPSYVSTHASSFIQRDREIYDYAAIQLKYDTGFQFSLIVSWYAAEKIRTWYLAGSENMVKFDDINKTTPITLFQKGATVIDHVDQSLPWEFRIREEATVMPHISQEEPLAIEVRQFVDSIRGSPTVTDALQGVRVVKVLEAIEESARNKGTLVKVAH
jgi:UDP-N-acetylglucosamine 3-dehydrogenase